MKMYVGNLASAMTDQDLLDLFSPYGDVVSAKITVDKENRNKGFGYVEMSDDGEAMQAMAQLNDSDQGGRKMIVTANAQGEAGGFRKSSGGGDSGYRR